MGKEEVQKNYTVSSIDGMGQVQISNEVVTIIAGLAATEVKGVASMVGNITNELVSKLGIKNLSKGYRQRTGLAAAILDFPDIIILDEPTVGLDPKQIIEIRELIRTLAKDHTVILSSHILAEVQEICDDILIISKGKLIAEGSPDELEELTQGKETIELTILADETSVKQVLSDFSDIDDVNWLDVSENSCHIQINTNKDSQEICADLSLKFAQKKMPVTQMFVNKATLEDIFLELTGKEVMEVTNNACYL